MTLKSTKTQYGVIAVTIHWLSVILILMLIGSGFRASGIEDAVAKAAVLRLHIPLGISILLLTVARLCWWFFADTKPGSVPMPRWQDRVSRAIHFLFYVVILGMASSGVGMMILSGVGPAIFGGTAETLPDFWEYPARVPHGMGARVMVALLVIHAGAALYHHFFKRDGLLWRMWFVSRTSS